VFNPHGVRAKAFAAGVEPEQCAPDGSDDGDETPSRCDGPPVETYDVAVEDERVVVYL
jgi:hypothetical protein